MELKFHKSVCQCLRQVVRQIQSQEQTQELRLTEEMPDVGRVLGCWGQPLIRGKEWRNGGMTVSGGVMAWVLYAPEDHSTPRSMEAWIPFQLRWDFPETKRDGIISVVPKIRNLDCRTISARKMMLRASISVLGEATEPSEVDIYLPEEPSGDVQLLKQSYPMVIPKEAGEKSFQVEEDLVFPNNMPKPESIIRYEVIPSVTEKKVLAGRLVFRGNCKVQILYSSQQGSLHTCEMTCAFSQFADLDHDYGNNADAWIRLIITGLEMTSGEESKLICGLSAQYVVYDDEIIEILEDAYCPYKNVNLTKELLSIPSRLDVQEAELNFRHELEDASGDILDLWCSWEHPQVMKDDDYAEITLGTQIQMLHTDADGAMQSGTARMEESWNLPSDGKNQISVDMIADYPEGSASGGKTVLSARARLRAMITCCQELSMVTSVEVTDKETQQKDRPSLVLCRVGEQRLWDLAKQYDSTVDAIRSINQIQQEAPSGSYVLIPIQ